MESYEKKYKAAEAKEAMYDKPADKVEPKFKVGEWITHNTANFVFKIINVGSNGYEVVNRENYKKTISFDNEDNYHLWTIQDAKDGDVLVFKNNISGIIICKSPTDYDTGSYCRLVSDNLINKEESGWDSTLLVPAAKEQRDVLMKAMTDAGYTFDFEKKELKKIDNETEIPFSAKDSELQEATYYIPKGFYAEIDDDKVVIKKDEQPAAWSEEDNMMIEETLYFLREYQQSNRCKDESGMQNSVTCEKWLKSLKERIGG